MPKCNVYVLYSTHCIVYRYYIMIIMMYAYDTSDTSDI